MHPVILRHLAAEHIKEMHAKADDQRRTAGPGVTCPARRRWWHLMR